MRVRYTATLLALTLLMTLTAFVGSASGVAAGWATKTPMPEARYKATAVLGPGGNIYVIGGKDATNTSRDTVFAYTPSTDSWTTVAPLPTARRDVMAATVGGKVYAIGGAAVNTDARLDTVDVYDPSTDSWSEVAPMPTPRMDGLAEVVGGKIYVIGGFNTAFQPTPVVEAYDPATNTWTSGLAPMPTSRFGFGGGLVNGKIYAIGGFNNSQMFNTVEAYDPVTDSWTTDLNPMPTKRYYFASDVAGDGAVYVAGGYDDANNIVATTERYDPVADSWSTVDPMPAEEYGPAGTSGADGVFYVFASYNPQVGYDSRTFAYNLAPAASKPGIPSNVTASPSASGEVTVHWNPPASDGGSPITRYDITVSNGQVLPAGASATQLPVAGLTNCAPYSFSVQAVNGVGPSDPSSTVSATPSQIISTTVTESGLQYLYDPKNSYISPDQCVRVTFAFSSNNLRTHSVTETTNGSSGLGASSKPLFDSGLVGAGGSYTTPLLTGAAWYQWHSTNPKDSNTAFLFGSVVMPLVAAPSSGTRTSSYTLTWAQSPMPGYSFAIQYQFLKAGDKKWSTTWNAATLTNVTSTRGSFVPPSKNGAGSYRFRARLKNDATGKMSSGYSYVSEPACVCLITVT